eukprot:TRINITY_DN23570_c0_g1_i1.p4 TRINITY_DN23570_c0_g1~~TRINITY_DN23570_c0_g1_i1.p4  ORF type:complete len:117 (-),score=15.60 TRINITY_DN23570_c0_g1_i1:225-575(-)
MRERQRKAKPASGIDAKADTRREGGFLCVYGFGSVPLAHVAWVHPCDFALLRSSVCDSSKIVFKASVQKNGLASEAPSPLSPCPPPVAKKEKKKAARVWKDDTVVFSPDPAIGQVR